MCFSADQVQELVAECLRARDRAYCPYSRFPVGAAVLSTDGAIITGDPQTATPPVTFGNVVPLDGYSVSFQGRDIHFVLYFMEHRRVIIMLF